MKLWVTNRLPRRMSSSGNLHVERLRNRMEHDLQDTLSLLSRTPGVLNALLRDLPEMWTSRNEGENTWSAVRCGRPLIHAERTDWMPRVKMVLQFGDAQTFAPFDRWGMARETQGKSLGQLLDEFAGLRSENLGQLRGLNLQPADLQRRGRHPALGVVTLSELLATWATHDLTHLHQISTGHGPPVPRSCGPVERIPRRAAVRRSQLLIGNVVV